ncbi:MAG: SRPBCC domain-containing protein, partial [Chloroflexota bacterium]
MTNPLPTADATRIERTYSASPETIWDLWTTSEGIGRWWAPDGFRTDVTALDLRPGGELVYDMTTVAPEMIAFMESVGMPLVTQARKTFTEIDRPHRLSYLSLIDFVPGREPYQHLTVVDLAPDGAGTK